jgi:pimeloyl-ACP methyl ester carboxylesterase/predicted amidohydrolase
MDARVAFCRNRDGRRIGYMTWGNGPALVVPPGWISHLELQWQDLGMEPFYARLAESFRVICYDRRGCGLSERARDDFTLDADVADLETVIDEVAEGDTVSLLGISQAGPICIAYAAAHPERVMRLVLFGAYATGELVAREEVRASLVGLVRASWGLGSEALASLFVPASEPAFRENLARFQREAATREMAAALLESVFRFDVASLLETVRAPTLVIHRRRDRAIPSQRAVDLAASIPEARLVQLEGDVHFPWLGDWETVAELVEDFVLGLTRERSRSATPSRPAADAAAPHYQLVHYRVDTAPEQPACRIALAQIGEQADLPVPGPSGAYRLPDDRVEHVAHKLDAFVARAAEVHADLVVFPEMSIDLNHELLARRAQQLARDRRLMLVLGGYHDEITRANVCVVLGPDGVLWQQRKHIPALLRSGGGWVEEPIEMTSSPRYVIGSTRIGRIAIAICRDFLDLELRVAFKNSEPPVDLVINPAFTPVTADFQAAHFEARRALYACTLFCNFAVFGGSCIESPEKSFRRVELAAGEERLAVADVPLFAMRAERNAWDAQAHRRFIQSTRH